MPTTMIALWKEPADQAAFEEEYLGTHVPLVNALPGLRALRSGRVLRGPYYRVAAMEFDDAETLKTAMRSEEGQRMGADSQRLREAFGVEIDLLTVESD